MIVAILFHFNKHTETVSIDTNCLSSHLQQKINQAIQTKKRIKISFDSFQSIKNNNIKTQYSNIDSILSINVAM